MSKDSSNSSRKYGVSEITTKASRSFSYKVGLWVTGGCYGKCMWLSMIFQVHVLYFHSQVSQQVIYTNLHV